MKLSSQEEYGLRCLLRVAQQGPDGSLTLGELSRLEGISVPHVAKLMRALRTAGLVRSTRGKEGGYALARPAEEVYVGHVLECLGGRLYDPTFCDQHTGLEALCARTVDCAIRSVWQRLQMAVDQVLGRLTLKDLLRSEEEMGRWDSGRAGRLPVTASPDRA